MKTYDIVMVGVFASLHVLAAVMLRFGGEAIVPFSLVPLMVILAGLLLGAKRGALSLIIYTMLGLTGVPVFSKPPYAGLTYVLQPTFGFIIGFILAAYVVGSITKDKQLTLLRAMVASVGGIIVIYFVGLPYLYAILNLYLGVDFGFTKILQTAFIPFIGLDILKAVSASLVAQNVYRRLPKRFVK